MKFSLCFISLITIYILPKTYSKGSQKVPGNVSCVYFASLKEDCSEPAVDASALPNEATSIFYSGLAADATLNVTFGYTKKSNDEHMKSMLSTDKSVFLFYYHRGDDQLMAKISNNSQDGGKNAKTEMSNLKTFLEPYKDIAGFSVYGVSHSANYTTSTSLTENFKIYIDEMRWFFPDYGIGLSIDGEYLSKMIAEPNPPVWFDISVLDSSVDFYFIDLYFLNYCTKDFKDSSSPINGSAPYTMDKLKSYFTNLGIPIEKTYYMYSAAFGRNIDTNASTCDVTNAKICEKPRTRYCPESTQSFFDKGAFAKKNGAGFIIADVDLDDDPHGCCQCSPYPAFQRILAGFNGDPLPPVCPLLEGQ